MIDTLVIGAGPAGVLAALRAADLGARTVLVTRAEFGGMAANDGPVPVRALAHAARLIREARLVPHLCRNTRSRSGQRGTRTQSEGELASKSSREHLASILRQ